MGYRRCTSAARSAIQEAALPSSCAPSPGLCCSVPGKTARSGLAPCYVPRRAGSLFPLAPCCRSSRVAVDRLGGGFGHRAPPSVGHRPPPSGRRESPRRERRAQQRGRTQHRLGRPKTSAALPGGRPPTRPSRASARRTQRRRRRTTSPSVPNHSIRRTIRAQIRRFLFVPYEHVPRSALKPARARSRQFTRKPHGCPPLAWHSVTPPRFLC